LDDAELERLAARVDALEREVAQLRYGIAAPQPATPPVTQRIVTQTAAPLPAATQAKRRDVESVVGGRGLLYAGALLVLLGVSSFLKIAFDRGWIGPPMRVALGLIAGAALIAFASALRKRLHPYFADSLAGLGAAICYLCLYAAGAMFHILPPAVVAVGAIAITVALGVLAYGQNRQPLAFFGIIGGLMVPILLDGGGSDSLLFYAYLAALSSAAVVLGELRGWRALPLVALCGTVLYWLAFSFEGDANKFAERLVVGIVLYVLFASTMLLAWRRREVIDGWRIAIASVNGAWFFFGISALAQGHDTILAIVFLGIAALHVLAGRFLVQRQQYWLAVMALAFAIPPVCDAFSSHAPAAVVSTAIHLAWIVEATIVGILGARRNDRVLVVLAGTLFATAIVSTGLAYGLDDLKTLLNDRFISLVAAAGGIGLVRRELAARGLGGSVRVLGKIVIDCPVRDHDGSRTDRQCRAAELQLRGRQRCDFDCVGAVRRRANRLRHPHSRGSLALGRPRLARTHRAKGSPVRSHAVRHRLPRRFGTRAWRDHARYGVLLPNAPARDALTKASKRVRARLRIRGCDRAARRLSRRSTGSMRSLERAPTRLRSASTSARFPDGGRTARRTPRQSSRRGRAESGSSARR